MGSSTSAPKVDLRLSGSSARFQTRLPLDALNGTFQPDDRPPDAELELIGDYGISGATWDLAGSVQGAPLGSDGSVRGGSITLLYIEPFDTRVSDGDAASVP